MAVRGGHKLKAWLREAQTRQSKIKKIEIGFVDEQGNNIPGIAATHEFGLDRAGVYIPERPAFRLGIEAAKRETKRERIQRWRANKGYLTDADVLAIARKIHAIIKREYLTFQGTELSPLQKERKRGTPGEGKQLQGTEGPKLIEHVGLWVDGVRRD